MGQTDRVLKRALSLIKNHKYSSVIRLLESKIPHYLENDEFMLYLGASCFYIGDIGGAVSYLGRGDRIDPDNTAIQLYLAASHLKKNNTTEAVRIWLAVLDIDEQNKEARKGLDIIRSFGSPDDQRKFCQSKKILQLVPGFGLSVSTIVFVLLLAVFVGIATTFILLLSHYGTSGIKRETRADRVGVERSIDRRETLADTGETTYYILTEKEVKASFRRAIDAFNDGDDNLARMEINRIKLSNASSLIKGKIHLLEGHLEPPGFDTFRTNFSFQDVVGDPQLFNGCHVLWRGKVSNLIETEDSVSFDLLAGYDSGQVLDGVIPVKFNFFVSVNPDLPVEVIGEVHLGEGQIYLNGVSIHTIILK